MAGKDEAHRSKSNTVGDKSRFLGSATFRKALTFPMTGER